MDAYSLDLRLSIVRACVQQPETREEVAELFGVSRSFVQKLLRRWYAGMGIAPKAHSGGAAPLLDESARDQLRQMLLEKPDAALAELCQGLKRQRVAVSPATVCRALQDLGLPIKKSLHADQRDTPRVRALRGWWWRRAAQTPVEHFLFIDESGANTAMTPLYGRAPPGQRVPGHAPGGWQSLTLLAALRLEGVAAASILKGSVDAAVFASFVRNAVLPVLRPGDVVVWDNLSSHRVAGLEEEIQTAEATLRLLPPYSPDLTPVEPLWSKLKQFLRKAEPRTPATLIRAAHRGFSSVTEEDAHGWFAHCGYCVH